MAPTNLLSKLLEGDIYEKVLTLHCVEGWDVTILWEGGIVILNQSISTAHLIFDVRRGVCHHYAITLSTLYQCYFDLFNTQYRAYYLTVSNPSKDFYHACVLLKSPYGKVAIVDWTIMANWSSPIMGTGFKITFRSVYDETKFHQEWWDTSLNYTNVMSRDFSKALKNNDEFFAWAQGS